jgi:hypothetical protein
MRSRWWFLKFLNVPSTLKKCKQKCSPSEKRAGNCHVLADSRWEMLLEVVGQLLGMLKGCRKAAGICPEAIGKPLGNS